MLASATLSETYQQFIEEGNEMHASGKNEHDMGLTFY